MVVFDQVVSPDGLKLEGFGYVGKRKAILRNPMKSIYIPDMLEFRLNAIVKSPFPTNDAICNKLGNIRYF